MIGKKTALLMALLFALSVFTVMYPRINYLLPIHFDEFDHLALLRETLNEGQIIHYDPYTPNKFVSHNIEAGYELFLAPLALIEIKPELLPVIVSIFISFTLLLSVFVLARHIAKSELAGLLSAIFVSFMPNSISLLGNWFMVPVPYGMILIAILFYSFIKGLESKKFAFLFPFFALQTVLVHPPSMTVVVPAFAAYFLLTPGEIKKHFLEIIALIAGLIAITVFFLGIKAKSFAIETFVQVALNEIIFKRQSFDAAVNLWNFLNPIMVVFCLIGMLYLLKPIAITLWNFLQGKKIESLEHSSKILVIAIVLMYGLKLYADLTGTVYLTIYPRLVMDLVFLMLIVAGIGAYAVFKAINWIIAGFEKFPAKIAMASIAVFFLIFSIFAFNYISFTGANSLNRTANENDLSAISWLKQNTPSSSIIIGEPGKLKAVNFFSNLKVVGTSPTRVGNLFSKKIIEFLYASCDEKNEIVSKNGFHYSVFFDSENTKSDCTYLNRVYSQGDSISVYFKAKNPPPPTTGDLIQ